MGTDAQIGLFENKNSLRFGREKPQEGKKKERKEKEYTHKE